MQSVSQFGEDVLVWEYFGRNPGIFVDVGAHHPVRLSQTWLLEQNGWRGILIEASSAHLADFRSLRPSTPLVQAAVGTPEMEGQSVVLHLAGDYSYVYGTVDAPATTETETVCLRTLNSILAEQNVTRIDYLTIDVEGMEAEVLRGFDFARYRPRLILIEDHWHNYRAHILLRKNGYHVVKRSGCNSWYIPQGSPAPATTWGEQFTLWRRMWLHAPNRQFKLWRKRRKKAL